MSPKSTKSPSLRPQRLEDYLGQEQVTEILKVAIDAAKREKRQLDHILLNGPPGLGKTTLARIIAKEMGWQIRTMIGASLKTANDVKVVAFSIPQKGQVILFIDEVHRVGRPAQEVMYPMLEDGIYHYKVGDSSTEVELPVHSVIGATTNVGRLEAPFIDRFGLQLQLEYYDDNELMILMSRSADVLGVKIDEIALREVMWRSRATPRIGNNLLKRLKDYNVARGIELNESNVRSILWKKFHLDHLGLNSLDRRVLRAMAQAVGPVGIDGIAVLVGEEVDTIESKVEPFLMRRGLMERTTRGRVITEAGRKHLDHAQR